MPLSLHIAQGNKKRVAGRKGPVICRVRMASTFCRFIVPDLNPIEHVWKPTRRGGRLRLSRSRFLLEKGKD